MSVATAPQAPGDGDRQAAFAATLVDEWVRAGLSHAVVCPGSRSTPLALAIAAEPRLNLHVRLDERSAGFTALGIAMATGMPAVVVVTSGTAAAELHAGVVEADLAGVPMLVCTADRPPELRDVGAPQTIDQVHLYGRSVRWFADPGVPDDGSRSVWRSLGSRSVAEAVSGSNGPGPVHLNLPFREPLLGDADRGGIPEGRPDGLPWHRVDAGPLAPSADLIADLIADLLGELRATRGLAPAIRGVIVAGAGCGDPDAVLGLAEALSWPVLADPRSGLRGGAGVVITAADSILRAPGFAVGRRADMALRLGDRWASKVVNSYLADIPSVVVSPTGRWTDPEHGAGRMVRCDPTLLCEALVGALSAMPDRGMSDRGTSDRGTSDGGTSDGQMSNGEKSEHSESWPAWWAQAEARARQVIDGALGTEAAWTEPALAHRLTAALPAGSHLMVSSSMPIRDIEAFASPVSLTSRVFANRGANGIDGVVSTALGIAMASGPTVVLVGDLAFLHDVSALVGPSEQMPPLTVVVADNGGGGIFSFLPPASTLDGETFEQLFATPQSADVGAVAAGFGWTVEEIDEESDSDALVGALRRSADRGGGTVIRVRLPDRAANVAEHNRINAAIVEVVEG